MRGRILRLTAAVLAAAMLSSCGFIPRRPADVTPSTDGDSDTPSTPVTPDRPSGEGYSRADELFTVMYSPSDTMNPFTGTNIYNEQIFGLIYEGLFALTAELGAEPVLCESFETEDGTVWELKLRGGVRFHDGTVMTAEDVVYSLETARSSSKFAQRLSDITAVSGQGDTVTVRLRRANYMLPKLLDVPIVKNGTAQEDRPVGTGPYVMGSGRLEAFTGHRDYTESSLQAVYLHQTADEDLAEVFSERDVDILDYDPTGLSGLNIHAIHETRFYDTSSLIYLGLNCAGTVLRDAYVRRALMRLVNSDVICQDIYGNNVRRSTFILDPVLGDYEEFTSTGYGYSRQDFMRLSTIAGLEDIDGDGNLDYYDEPFALRFIVNTESSYKLSAARRITTDLQNVGINVTLDILSFSDYETALRNRNFDLYLGEAHLRADLDPTELLLGKLNYGRIPAGEYRALINAYLASPEGEDRVAAGTALCTYVAEDAAIVPICYKQRTVLTHVGVVSGLEPSQSGLFRGILGLEVDLSR